MWKAVERYTHPAAASWQELPAPGGSDEEYMAIGSSAFGEDFGSNPPLRGEEMRALLSDDDIKAAVAEVLLKDDMRKVYNKFMLSIKFGGLDIVGRRKVLKNWCYKGWDEEL